MKELFLIRHAKSSWSEPTLSDHDRPLNDRGKRDAPMMADILKRSGLTVDGLVSSTAKRAFVTAKTFAKVYGVAKGDIVKNRRLYHADPREIITVIQQLPDEWDRVLVFGHNPGFTEMANLFPGEYIDNVPTCGIVGTRAKVEKWSDWTPEAANRFRYFYPKKFL